MQINPSLFLTPKSCERQVSSSGSQRHRRSAPCCQTLRVWITPGAPFACYVFIPYVPEELKERKMRGIKWQINLLTKHLPLGSHLSVCRRPGCLLCHPRDGLLRTEWDAMHGQKLRAMVIHHEKVKTSTFVPPRRHPVNQISRSHFSPCISHNAICLGDMDGASSQPRFQPVDYTRILHLDLSWSMEYITALSSRWFELT